MDVIALPSLHSAYYVGDTIIVGRCKRMNEESILKLFGRTLIKINKTGKKKKSKYLVIQIIVSPYLENLLLPFNSDHVEVLLTVGCKWVLQINIHKK